VSFYIKKSVFCFTLVCCVLCELCESVLALLGGVEGRVPRLMTAAVESDVSNSFVFIYSLMCRPWGIQLKRERNEVCVSPKGILPRVTFSVGRMRGAIDLGSLMTTSSRTYFQIPT
jgi:hypothetical protein